MALAPALVLAVRPRVYGLFDQSGQAHATLDRCVEDEVKLRHSAKPKAVRQPRAQEPSRMLERTLGLLHERRRSEHSEEHFCMGIVCADLDPSERDHPDTRILQLKAHQFRDLALKLVGDSPRAL